MKAKSARQLLADALKPALPKNWQIVSGGRSVGQMPNTVVQIRQTAISHPAAAPIATHEVELLVTISAPEKSTGFAEDTLDYQVDELLHALDGMNVRWTKCDKVTISDGTRLAYDITILATSQKEN